MSNPISYCLDENDHLLWVNEEWTQFAVANDGPELYSQNIIGRSLWDFISDGVTRKLYRKVIDLVRSEQEPLELIFRCDAPTERRLLEMTIAPSENAEIQFTTRFLCVKPRPEQRLLKRSAPRDRTCLLRCSWCSQVCVGPGHWLEVEEAIHFLKLEQVTNLPYVENVTCPRCLGKISEIIESQEKPHPESLDFRPSSTGAIR